VTFELEWEKIIDYYRLRFQIEFNFRDAKQHWGLEDFMVIKKQSVFNAANLSLWMVNVSQATLAISGEESILDLKARQHGLRYAQELFKILPKNTKPINIVQLFEKIPVLGRIHVKKNSFLVAKVLSKQFLLIPTLIFLKKTTWKRKNDF